MKSLLSCCLLLVTSVFAADFNLKILTDASPDFTDLPSLVRSETSLWPTPKEKLWAVFYWNHIARRQTVPIELHGMALTDPIRQFNDYGYTMCSTISGISQSIFEEMGLKHKYWDVALHTIPEVEYDGKFHMYDNSLSAIYTLCDGKTIAGVEDLGKEGACELSGGKVEPGHIARYHCLCATSPNGFLSGADCPRTLLTEGTQVFKPNVLKFRDYYYDWDRGHHYTLNLRDNETYTRYYHRMDKPENSKDKKEDFSADPAFYVPNASGKDAEATNPRYKIRGNGRWTFKPELTAAEYKKYIYTSHGITANDGLHPEAANVPSEVVFRVQSANVTTSQHISAAFNRKTDADLITLYVSNDNGLNWKEVWKAAETGTIKADLRLIDDVNSAYEPLLKVELLAKAVPQDAALKNLEINTLTQLNSKTQPKLNLGKNTIYVGDGEKSESIVFWPDLRGDTWKSMVIDSKNIVTDKKHTGWHAIMRQAAPGEAYVTYKMDAPAPITKISYGGRMYNNGAGSHISFYHSFDRGKTWQQSYTLGESKKPWDVIHYETIDKIPPGTTSVQFKYLIDGKRAGEAQTWGFYALRMEAFFTPADVTFKPLEVTYKWKEVQKDSTTVERSHTQLVEKTPFKYSIDTAGEDQPIMESLQVNLKGAVPDVKFGYSDGKDVGGEKYLYRWRTEGKNLAKGKPYTLSIPPNKSDDEAKKLTDGVVGPSYAGGAEPAQYGVAWDKGKPEITVDLGDEQTCGAFRIHITAGYPWWDALKGEVKDKVELLVSNDGKEFTSVGHFNMHPRRKDIPINHMMPDDENGQGWNYELIPDKPVKARYVKYAIDRQRWLSVTEVQVFDWIKYEPFDIKVALPE